MSESVMTWLREREQLEQAALWDADGRVTYHAALVNDAPRLRTVVQAAAEQEHMHDTDMGMKHTYPNPLVVPCSQCAALRALTEAP